MNSRNGNVSGCDSNKHANIIDRSSEGEHCFHLLFWFQWLLLNIVLTWITANKNIHNTMVRVNAAANKLATAIIEFVLHFEWKRIVMVTLVDGVCGLGASGIYEGLKVKISFPIFAKSLTKINNYIFHVMLSHKSFNITTGIRDLKRFWDQSQLAISIHLTL